MPMATDSGTEAAGESRRLSCFSISSHMATPVVVAAEHRRRWQSSLHVTCWTTKKAARRRRHRHRRRYYLWADVPADILGTVLRLLPCVADRASVRSVCRHWRAAALVHALPAPLPVLVVPGMPTRFRSSCLISDGLLAVPRRALMPVEAAGDDVRIVGSSVDDWLVAVRPSSDVNRETDGECFLVNTSSGEVVHLPPLSPHDYSSSAPTLKSFLFIGNERQPWLNRSAVLSASPTSGSKYTVAALSYSSAAEFFGVALWQPGMTSWYLCRSARIMTSTDNLALYQGKLYMVWKTSATIIFAFEIREEEHGVRLSCPDQYVIDPLSASNNTNGSRRRRCNLVVWRGKLLLIIRFFRESMYKTEHKPESVEVFALDFSTSPCGVTQIHNFDGDCIFVDTYGCRSFSAGLHVGVRGDLIYFADICIHNRRFPYVYNMRDGTVRRFAAGLPKGCIGVPIWFFPSS